VDEVFKGAFVLFDVVVVIKGATVVKLLFRVTFFG